MVPGQVIIKLKQGADEAGRKRACEAVERLPDVYTIDFDTGACTLLVNFDNATIPEKAVLQAVRDAGVEAEIVESPHLE